jgi:hypothetical protein
VKQAIAIFLFAVHLLSPVYGHTIVSAVNQIHTLTTKDCTHKKQDKHTAVHFKDVRKGLHKHRTQPLSPFDVTGLFRSEVTFSYCKKSMPGMGNSVKRNFSSGIWQPPQ